MFRIAKNLVRTLEESVSGSVSDKPLDSYFNSVPPQLFPIQDSDPRYSQQKDSLYGLRVVQVDETQLQLSSFFDYIIGFNNEPVPTIMKQTGSQNFGPQLLYPDYARIIAIFNEHCGSSIKLHVWSGKGGVYREEHVHVSPAKSMSEIPLDDTDMSSQNDPTSMATSKVFEPLGFKVQWTPLVAATYSYHVLQLNIDNGPAAVSGLIPDQDYIIACQEGLLATGGEHLLQDIVRSRANHSLVLYVYNKSADCVRPVNVQIGPDGRLGCNVGYGFLHRIPAPIPAATQEASARPQIIIPAMQGTVVSPPPASSASKKQAHHHANPPVTAMADYFQEGKDQSPKVSAAATPPPPPPQTKAT